MARSKQTNKTFITQLLYKHPIISDQVDIDELAIILQELSDAYTNNPGNVVEFGCYVGTTSLFLQRVMQSFKAEPKSLYVYDSFEGLPDKQQQDISPVGVQFQAGKLKASKSVFIKNFKQANVPLPTIYKGWFNQLSPDAIPDNICFAFLDGDYYESIHQSLRLITPKLLPGATIIIDDYQSESLPGAKKAADEWLLQYKKSCQTIASLAVVRT